MAATLRRGQRPTRHPPHAGLGLFALATFVFTVGSRDGNGSDTSGNLPERAGLILIFYAIEGGCRRGQDNARDSSIGVIGGDVQGPRAHLKPEPGEAGSPVVGLRRTGNPATGDPGRCAGQAKGDA